jgi:hypothetical protein
MTTSEPTPEIPYEAGIRFLEEDSEINAYNSKYRTQINHEYEEDFIDLLYVFTFKKDEKLIEVFVKGINFDEEPDPIDGYRNGIIIYGIMTLEPYDVDLTEEDLAIAKQLTEESVNKYINDLQVALENIKGYGGI